MQNKVTYEYAIVRVVPRVEREEFINIGVILFSKRKKFLACKFHIATDKLNALASDIDVALIEKYLQAWKEVCAGSTAGGEIGKFEISDRFRWLAATRSTIIQSSKTHPGLCTNPAEELDDLMHKFVY